MLGLGANYKPEYKGNDKKATVPGGPLGGEEKRRRTRVERLDMRRDVPEEEKSPTTRKNRRGSKENVWVFQGRWQ